jgi:hypothetical protein
MDESWNCSRFGGVQPAKGGNGMDDRPTITLQYVQKDGKRERTKLTHHTLAEARQVAKAVLHVGNGLYTEVDICSEDGTIERIQNPATPSLLGRIDVR